MGTVLGPAHQKMKIAVLRSSETVFFAASELARYLRLISAKPVDFEVVSAGKAVSGALSIGVQSASTGKRGRKTHPWDDSIGINVRNGSGTITGANERSVLIGVYRFLYHLGCRWVRPGIDGEYLPKVDLSKASVEVEENASFRHRTICIEGAVSVENVIEMIDWAPKAGFSGYFMQFPHGNAFFERYYQHPGNPVVEGEPFSDEIARHFTIHIEQEIQKRGLIYHAVGHGWTCDALGMNIADWNPHYEPLAPEVKELIAEVKGKREFQWDRPMITSLCFSRAEVERRMVEVILKYAVAHPEVDLLHVWLDDGSRNKCECKECSKQLPADLYAKLLRKLGAALDRAGSKVKIVFLGYSDLLWPPVKEKEGIDPERFVFMYANSRASYKDPLEVISDCALPKYERNAFVLKRDAQEFNAFLQGWQRWFGGDSFLFEYYMSIGRLTFDQYFLTEVIYEDLRRLPGFGINGLTSCQIQRVFFPAGLAMYVMGQMLWNNQLGIQEICNDFFYASFGKDNALCKEFLKVSAEELGRSVRLEGGIVLGAKAAMHLCKLEGLIEAFQKVVDANRVTPELCQARSWYYMNWYLRILRRMVGLYQKLATGAPIATVMADWAATEEFICANEDRYQAVFDVHSFCSGMERYITQGKVSTDPADVV